MLDSPTRPVIRTPDQRLRVFVSSTLQELADERVAARTAIARLRLAPVMFELGARPHPPRDLYRAYLEQSHIFIGIYWQKYGWVAPGMDVSGLEDEYRLSGSRPKLIYIKSPAPDREPRLKELLDQIKGDESVSYKPFATTDELHDLIENDLAMVLSERFEMTQQPGAAPQENVPERRNHNLPAPRTSLVGRDRELGLACDLLLRESPPVRLVTLTGPGGSGKTRLALQVAHDLLDRFASGVFFVALAPVTDPRLVIPTIAQVLSVREAGGRPLIDSLKDYLREKRMLLVLDNFEQVVSAAPVVVELFDASPFLKVLVTSRTSLRVRAERELPVLPLALPERKHLPETEQLSQYAAVKLFIQRARDVRSDFALTDETAQVVAEICHRLDGLPLAIELAAARIKLLSPRALLARLESGLDMLAGGARDLPARQQTMRATIAWSYDLLNETEKALYRRLSVFVGGWTLEAAESVCSVGAIDVLDTLASLADKNLVRHEELPGGESRYGMLQTIREYGLERLQEGGECAAVRRRHAEFCLSLAEAAEPHLMSADRNPWLDRLELEHDNLRAALTWCMSTDGDPELGATLAGALTWFWFLRGHISEGRESLEHALAGVLAPGRTFSRARCLHGAGGLAWAQGDYAAARMYLDECVTLSRELRDEHRTARALSLRGLVALSQVDLASAHSLLQESMNLFRQVGDTWGEAFAVRGLGDAALVMGGATSAEPLYKDSLALWRKIGDPWGLAMTLHDLGRIASMQGNYTSARTLYTESAALVRQIGDKWGLALVLVGLGHAVCHEQDTTQAEAIFKECLELWRELGNRVGVIQCVSGFAGVAAVRGDAPRAARLFGAASALYRSIGFVLEGTTRTEFDRNVAAARDQIDAATWSALWREGEVLTLDQAIAHALGE